MAQAINTHGGKVSLPHGHGRCLVACLDDAVVGMVYTTPPIRWLQEQPAARRNSLAKALVEIELLAVAEPYRGQGIATALLDTAEEAARGAGTLLALAKVRIGAFATMRWYRRRGYAIAAQGEPVVFRTRAGFDSCDDGSDGYQLAVKALRHGAALRRRTNGGVFILVAEHQP
ncbi:GNAT family N-acetyltransferase [Streptomyces sp. NPDC127033]|uniref:GNAT family N-acetyltransferase n=1 Tax=Streptomyces sp. NPDC127033 TaxID=3347110 RepID=UPI003662DEAE